MKNLFRLSAICILIAATTSSYGQQANLWLEGNVTTNTALDDGFEDDNLDPFTSGGASNWFVQSTEVFSGIYAAKSGTISDNQSTFIQYFSNVTEPSTLEFAAKVSSEASYDLLSFEVNGELLLSLSGEQDWKIYKYVLTQGMNTLKWTYSKDVNTSAGLDAGWLDNVVIQYNSGQVLQISDGLEGPGKLLISDENGKANWASPGKIFNENSLPLVLHKDMPFGAYGPNDYAPLIIENKLGAGIRIRQAEVGIRIDSSSSIGFYSTNAGNDGFSSLNSADDGFSSLNSADDGFYSDNATDDGFYSTSSGGNGFYSSNSAVNGFYSFDAGSIGFLATSSEDHGFYAHSAGDDGFYSFDAVNDGFQSDNAGNNGFVSLTASVAGFYSFNAGNDGFQSTNAGDDGFYAFGSTGDAAFLSGTATVTGMLSKGGGTFKIDHPLDPENKFLTHSFVESPDMTNFYNGNIITDADGIAVIEMPEWFDVLNRDFRYQLTVIGVFSQAIIKEKINVNQFTIQTDQPNVEVSWQVTGIRQDKFANQNRVEVEVEKPAEFKGYYLHPEAYNMPFEKGFDFVKNGYKTLAELRGKGKQNDKLEEGQKEKKD